MLSVGDRAPDFTAESSTGERVSLAALRGRVVVLYFYPKAFTPGCTRETRRFRDNHEELAHLGATVLGVSTDTLDTQCRFASAEQVKFPLLADDSKAISRAFGVVRWGLGIDRRVTFVIDEQGAIAAVFQHEFQISKHLDEVVRFLEKRR